MLPFLVTYVTVEMPRVAFLEFPGKSYRRMVVAHEIISGGSFVYAWREKLVETAFDVADLV